MSEPKTITQTIEESYVRFNQQAAEDVAFTTETIERANAIARRSRRMDVVIRSLLKLAEDREKQINDLIARIANGGPAAKMIGKASLAVAGHEVAMLIVDATGSSKAEAFRTISEAYAIDQKALERATPSDGFVNEFTALTNKRETLNLEA